MRHLLPLTLSLGLGLVLTAGCSDKVVAEGLGNLPVDDVEYSFYARETSGNLEGGTLTATVVVLTDRADMCEAAEAVGGVAAVDDMFAVQIVTATNGSPSNIDSNTPMSDLLFNPSPAQGLVAARVYERRGGETLLNAVSRNVVEIDAVTQGEFVVNSASGGPNGSKIGGRFEVDVDLDLTGGGEGEPLSGFVKGRFTGAVECDAIGGNVQAPDGPGDPDGPCDDVRYDNPNPSDQPFFEVEFGDVCAGTEDTMTYNVGGGCTTRLDINVPDAFDASGNQVRDVSLGLFYAGGDGTSPTDHSRRVEREIDDLRVYLEGGGDSFGAVTARIRHVSGDGAVPYELTVVTDCP